MIEALSSAGAAFAPPPLPAAARPPVEEESPRSADRSVAAIPYPSPRVRTDPGLGIAVLEFRDPDTGEATQQFPSAATLAYREAAGLMDAPATREVDIELDGFGTDRATSPAARPADGDRGFTGMAFGSTSSSDGARGSSVSLDL